MLYVFGALAVLAIVFPYLLFGTETSRKEMLRRRQRMEEAGVMEDSEFVSHPSFIEHGLACDFILEWRSRIENAIKPQVGTFKGRLRPDMTLYDVETLYADLFKYDGEWQLDIYDKIDASGGDPSFMKDLDCTIADIIQALWEAEKAGLT